ncbi:MAG: DNA-binding transcriptional regulator [Planctomycetia bacterium]|nr:DNA-binding transcriptional regulator [Planctomycetia bacterium]
MTIIRRKNIAVIVETMNSYGRGILTGICRYVQEQGNWTVQYTERLLESQPPIWLSDWEGDGIIVRDRTGTSCKLAMEMGVKVVDLSEVRHPNIPTVYSDHNMSAEMAADYFLERQFENFAYVGIQGRPFSEKRRDAFLRKTGPNCQVFDLENDPEGQASWLGDHPRFLEWLKQLPKPVAILACYDMVGMYVLQSCRLMNIHVPDMVAVMGINNDEIQCNLASPTLSSVVLNAPQVGYEACVLLDSLMRGEQPPERSMVVPTLGIVTRRSTETKVVPDLTISRAMQFIRDYACDEIDVIDVAEHVKLARRTLERRFAKVYNCTPNQMIIQVRLKRACDLLRNSRMLVNIIAERVGFQSSSYFTILFHKQFGLLPKDYRKQARSRAREGLSESFLMGIMEPIGRD